MNPNFTPTFGWVKDEPGFRAYAATLQTADPWWDQLKANDDGGDRFFYRALVRCLQRAGLSRWIKKRGSTPVLDTYNQLQVGSCVGNTEGKIKSHIAANDSTVRLDPEAFKNMFSPEFSYWASRMESGMRPGSGDGSTGFGAAKAAVKYGSLIKGVYGGEDITEYTETRCRNWGDGRGIPAEAKTEAAQHCFADYLKVSTAEQVWLLAGAAYPFNVCSNVGFENTRDVDGAIKPRGKWPHSMTAATARYTTKAGRKLVLIENSWDESWNEGPYYGDQPVGSFYVDLDVLADMVSEGDSFVDRGYIGHSSSDTAPDFTQM